ncbi:MAG: hypothetical protein H0X41_06755 [Chitinophagaceae bacterium]|nr:hypothetical protein [Chitinophagaceae bacterium]
MLYNIRSFGQLPGGTFTWGSAINNNGEVVGFSDLADGSNHATFWTEAGGLLDLGTLGGTESVGSALNDKSEVVGWSMDAQGVYRAFVWSPGTGMTQLPAPGSSMDRAWDINNAGQVVGSAGVGFLKHAALWQPGANALDLGTLGGPHSEATGINNTGGMTGWSQRTFSNPELSNPFVCKVGQPPAPIGTLNNLPTEARAISDDNHVVGIAYLPFTAATRAFIWHISTGIQDVGTLGGTWCDLSSINNKGIAVGFSDTATGQTRACMYDGGIISDLNTMLENHAGWSLHDAYDINDRGQIVGAGYYRGVSTGFLLTPVPLSNGREIIASVRRILSGVVGDNSGYVWPFGSPFPVRDPSPNPWPELSLATKELIALQAIKEMTANIQNESLRTELIRLTQQGIYEVLQQIKVE